MRNKSYNLIITLVTISLIAFWGCSSGGGGDDTDGDIAPNDGDQVEEEADKESDAESVKTDGDKDEDIADKDDDPDKESASEEDEDLTDSSETTDADEEEIEQEAGYGLLSITPEKVDFGRVSFENGGTKDIVLTNTAIGGSLDVTIDKFQLLLDSSPAIRLSAGCEAPFDISSQKSKTCTITCDPEDKEESKGRLWIVATGIDKDFVDYHVDIECGVKYPIAYADPCPVEFGYVKPGELGRVFVSIGNAGLDTLNISDITLESEDTNSPFSLVFPEARAATSQHEFNEGRVVELTYQPTDISQSLAWLVIKSNDPTVPIRTLTITGRGNFFCPSDPVDGDMDEEETESSENAESSEDAEADQEIADGDLDFESEIDESDTQTRWYGLKPTEDGKSCVDVCLPKTRRCSMDNNSYQVCSDTGDAWENAVECDEGMECKAGWCIWSLCEKDAVLCHAGASVSCLDKGNGYGTSIECDDSDRCTLDLCNPGLGCKNDSTDALCDDGNVCTRNYCDKTFGCMKESIVGECDDSSKCTENDRCIGGSCSGDIVNCDDLKACTIDSCNPSTGCEYTNKEGSCSDNNICTKNDHCEGGECKGEEFTCDDKQKCTEDSCDPVKGCIFTAKQEACNDENPCTDNDSCSSGVCKGNSFNPDDGLWCTGREVCNPEDGVISTSDIVCNDGVACTEDSCSDDDRKCSYNPVNSNCNDSNPCTADVCDADQGCLNTPVPDGTECPGLNTQCFNGKCTSPCSSDLDCIDEVACTHDACIEGYCRFIPVNNKCDDGLWCNGEEVCNPLAGCQPGETNKCYDEFACTKDYCDEDLDECVHTAEHAKCNDFNECTTDVCKLGTGCANIDRNGACNDNDPCSIGDFCSGGVCVAGPKTKSCEDDNPCTDNVCIYGVGCTKQFNNKTCSDDNLCTVNDTCSEGICTGTPKDCGSDVYCSEKSTCDPNTGNCAGGEAIGCDDGVYCTDDSCSEADKACEHAPDDSKCEDYDDTCTIKDVCTNEGCKYELAPDGSKCGESTYGDSICVDGFCIAKCESDTDCDDNVACTVDTCNTDSGSCEHIAGVCDDGKFCNGEEYCDLRLGCMPGVNVKCHDDGIACTEIVCDDKLKGCDTILNNDICDDNNSCTADVCSEQGCKYTVITGSCNDGNECTENDTCNNGVCGGDDVNCSDSNPCTRDYCLPKTGCGHSEADDGLSCGSEAVERYCESGECLLGCVSDKFCDDKLACTNDYCDLSTHTCKSVVQDQFCNDALVCNGIELCDDTQGCLPGTDLCTPDAYSCTLDICDEKDSAEHCKAIERDKLCEDNDPCTDDVCSKESGCENTEDTTNTCNDMDICTTNDSCASGSCKGDAVTCSDQNACTVDYQCDPELGCVYHDISDQCTQTDNPCRQVVCDDQTGCKTIFIKAACDDGDPCTEFDQCENGDCKGLDVICDDSNDCTEDRCEQGVGCVFDASMSENNSCSPTNALENQGTCIDGQCVTACTQDRDCFDSATCTQDKCNLITGKCEYVEDNSKCDDGNFCNGAETCQAYVGCAIGTPPTCDDGIACTVDSCNPGKNACDNIGKDFLCDDGNICTDDVCNVGSGCDNTIVSGRDCNDENRCSVNDTCQTDGTCSGSMRDCDDSNECTKDYCSKELGCVNSVDKEGESCGSDGVCMFGSCAESCGVRGNGCAQGLTCLHGRCVDACVNDTDCDDNIACTKDICDNALGVCRNITEDSVCDDGLFCNGEETCSKVLGCQNGAPPVCFDGIPCTIDSCDENKHACSFTGVNTVCDDGNICTEDVCCPEGECHDGEGCVYRSEPKDGTDCDDGNLCSEGDVCKFGSCIASDKVVCDPCLENNADPATCDPSNGCLEYDCDPRSGCFTKPNNGTACSSNACFNHEYCVGGECIGTIEKNCGASTQCITNECDPDRGCLQEIRNGQSCEDGNACTKTDVCNNIGECVPGATDLCDDSNECTDDSCNTEDGCSNVPVADDTSCDNGQGKCRQGVCKQTCDGGCDDSNPCTTDICDGGFCKSVPDDGACSGGTLCQPAVCDVEKGCVIMPEPDCDDSIACTEDYCDNGDGTCKHDPKDNLCDDNEACTTNTCDATKGCLKQSVQNGTACEDGNLCTTNEQCIAGHCAAFDQIDCDDLNPCTSDACNDADGKCEYTNLSGNTCDDNNLCTKDDQCNNGVCEGSTFNCDDNNDCTADYCDSFGRCQNQPLHGTSCTSSDKCAKTALCDHGICEAAELIDCADIDPCTKDYCDPATGCVNKQEDGLSCDDGDACTVGDYCSAGNCIAGTKPLVCKDNNACTQDSCDEKKGCEFLPVKEYDACDVNPDLPEVCISNSCVEYCTDTTGDQCNDNIDCTVDSCNLKSNTCQFVPDNQFCIDADGVFCNGEETCSAQTGCVPGVAPTCDDKISCTDDFCDKDSDSCKHLPQNYLCTVSNCNICSVSNGCVDSSGTACE